MTAVHPSDQSLILSKKLLLSPIILYRSLHQPLQAILSEGGGVSAGAIDTTYLLGNIVTVNGLFIGIINSTQIDMTNTVNTNGKNFGLIAINREKLFLAMQKVLWMLVTKRSAPRSYSAKLLLNNSLSSNAIIWLLLGR
jgi:hypothetical protein